MAAGRLAAPGTENGPCASECEHFDCGDTRAMAEFPCPLCGEAIGYGVGFYQRWLDEQYATVQERAQAPRLYLTSNRAVVLVHAACLEAQV